MAQSTLERRKKLRSAKKTTLTSVTGLLSGCNGLANRLMLLLPLCSVVQLSQSTGQQETTVFHPLYALKDRLPGHVVDGTK